MSLALVAELEIRTEDVAGRLVTRAYLGGRLLPLNPALLAAIAQLTTGRSLSGEQATLLVGAGVLVDTVSVAADRITWDAIAGRSTRHPLADEYPERVVPAPTLALGLEQPAQRTAGGVDILPASSLPIAMFVPPEILEPLQRLSAVLRQAWLQLLRNSQARGVLVDPDHANVVFERLVRDAHAADPALARAVDLAEPFGIVARAPLQDDAVHYPFTAITLRTDRDVRAADMLPTGEATVRIPMLADDGIAACGRLLGLLHAGVGPSEVAALLTAEPAARGLFGQLVALGLLVAAPARPRLADEVPPGTVVHLGHASLLAALGDEHVLIDPWFPPASTTDHPPPPAVAELPPLAAIFLTHHHWDHVHAETLMLLDKRTPVYLPAPDRSRALTVETGRFLTYLGFSDVRELAAGDEVAVGGTGRVIAAPFYGEDPTLLGYRGLCYVLEHDGSACLVHVDSAPDSVGCSMVSTGEARALSERYGALSPVFATRRQERGTMVEHPWEFLLASPNAWARPTENCDTGSAFLAELAEHTATSCLVLYSEGGAAWYPAWTNFLRPGVERGAGMPYEYLWEPLADIIAAIEQRGAEAWLSRPYDRYRIGGARDGTIPPRPRDDAP